MCRDSTLRLRPGRLHSMRVMHTKSNGADGRGHETAPSGDEALDEGKELHHQHGRGSF